MKQIFVLAGLFAAVYGQRERCCYPEFYEIHREHLIGEVGSTSGTADIGIGYTTIHYDLPGGKMALDMVNVMENSGQRRELKFIHRHDEDKHGEYAPTNPFGCHNVVTPGVFAGAYHYEIFPFKRSLHMEILFTHNIATTNVLANGAFLKRYVIDNGECKSYPMESHMDRDCIPSFMEHRNDWRLGAAPMALHVDEYYARDQRAEERRFVSRESCFMVGYELVEIPENAQDLSTLWSVQYYNATWGIADESVFNPPPNCTPGEKFEIPALLEPLTRI